MLCGIALNLSVFRNFSAFLFLKRHEGLLKAFGDAWELCGTVMFFSFVIDMIERTFDPAPFIFVDAPDFCVFPNSL